MLRCGRRSFLSGVIGSSALGAAALAPGAGDKRKVPCRGGDAKAVHRTEVLVIGAGSSGIPAAIAAARSGARVVLLEDDPVPGGAPVDMFVASPCGSPQVGIYREMLDQLHAHHNISLHPQRRATWFLPSSYVRVIMAMLGELPNLELICGVRVTRVLVGEGNRNRLEGVTIQRGSGQTEDILAAVVIDATGTAEVADMAGCPSMYGREPAGQHNEPVGPDKPDFKVQECTWMFITQKLRPDAVFDIAKVRWTPNESGYGWIKKNDPESVAGFKERNAGVYLHWGGHLICEDTRDPVSIAKTQLDAIKTVVELDGPRLMEFGYGMTLAPKLGMREGRRIIGDYVMTANDLTARWPDDVVCVGRYGLDAWGDKDAKTHNIQIPAEGYGIPYRTLLVKGMENLLVVGKAVSATHLAQSALRVQPIVSQMGQAAGTAAALAVGNKTALRSVEISELQERLKAADMLKPANSRRDEI